MASRRQFLTASALLGAAGIGLLSTARVLASSKEDRDRLSPVDVINMMKDGNERFRRGLRVNRDFLREQRERAAGQFPVAVILSCIDSRAPAELIMDLGIGDVFNVRVAGNVANPDILGSLEFACHVAGAKVALVLGHSSCGAIDGVELGHLTGLLGRIQPALADTSYEGVRRSSNAAFVERVARTNVERTIGVIRKESAILRELERKGTIAIAGAMYDLKAATVSFLPPHEE
ncbi:MAG: carbonic anhydrase [Nitrospira sp. SG-bin2]|uniref:carbonic anhydrase family protein n=1 Tax=Nitrospira cf. moscoviensis SBR1015 TaxID=96242 RepID=UPI000A0CA1C9|nr:carbonic anhydrase family protein [Nitrospira cf. moscoviensis SBR1015]OQW34354.1 MAG: carbonic anhydrase [Nitrospira sp. SG-bin2]